MSEPFYVKFKQPDGLEEEALRLLTKASRIRKGTNETTKSIERSKALLVFISKDVDPPEIVAHLPLLCQEKKIPYVYVNSRKDLGKAAFQDPRINVPMASCSITDPGDEKKKLTSLVQRLKELAGI